jgi:hypothetical protein
VGHREGRYGFPSNLLLALARHSASLLSHDLSPMQIENEIHVTAGYGMGTEHAKALRACCLYFPCQTSSRGERRGSPQRLCFAWKQCCTKAPMSASSGSTSSVSGLRARVRALGLGGLIFRACFRPFRLSPAPLFPLLEPSGCVGEMLVTGAMLVPASCAGLSRLCIRDGFKYSLHQYGKLYAVFRRLNEFSGALTDAEWRWVCGVAPATHACLALVGRRYGSPAQSRL